MRTPAAAAVLGCLAGLIFCPHAQAQLRHENGFLNPVFSPDGKEVYFVERTSSGVILGLGFEFFTPPAHVHVFRDRFRLRKMRFDNAAAQTVKDFPASPLEGRGYSSYRGYIFHNATASFRWTPKQTLDYEVRLDVPAGGQNRQYSFGNLSTAWGTKSQNVSNDDLSSLSGKWELIAIGGKDLFPCAVVADDGKAEIRTLIETSTCESLYPKLTREIVTRFSRRQTLERTLLVTQTYDRLRRQFLAAGMTEGPALLRAGKEMQRLGLFPKTPFIVAREIARKDLGEPFFHIDPMEFRVGLFQDIEQAIAVPGTEIDKGMGNYVTHRDYNTSAQINAFLASGGTRFFVERGGRYFEVILHRP